MAKANPHPFESREYILHAARHVQCLSILTGSPILPEVVEVIAKRQKKEETSPRVYQFQVRDGANRFDAVVSALGKPTEWPADAIERAKKFDGEFPQFSDLLTPIPSPDDVEEAAVKSPVLEQFAEDLHRSEKYQIWVQRKLWYRLKSLKGLPNRDALAEVLIGRAGYAVYRFLIGKSAQWAILATAEKSWLDVGLDFARSIPKRMDNDENYGQQNGPGPQDPSGPSPVSAFAGLESETPGPLDDLLDEETRKRLRDCIDKLPADQRELIEWLLEGQSLTDFAKATSKTISAVIRIRDKAYVNLKKCLDRNQGQ